MLKIVLLAYSRGIISSRAIERLCRENALFMAVSGDSAPQFTTIAKFVRELAGKVAAIFTQALVICDRQGLIGICIAWFTIPKSWRTMATKGK